MAKRYKIILLISFLLFFIIPSIYALEVTYPSFPGASAPQNSTTLPEYINYVFNVAVVGVGFLFVIVMIIGGVKYLMSRTGNVASAISAKELFTSSFVGLMILLTSYLVLKTINPSLINLTLPEKVDLEIKNVSIDTPPFPIINMKSLIETEIPISKLTQKILENKAIKEENEKDFGPEVQDPWEKEVKDKELTADEKKKSRMERITDIANNFLELANNLESQSKDLKTESGKCSCSVTRPCCEEPNPGEGCKDNTCTTKPGCTCDPCKQQRDKIQELEKKNLEHIYLGTKIKETTTGLMEEQKKANKEIKLMKEELGKMDNAQYFMLNCPMWALQNLSEMTITRQDYDFKGWPLWTANFWKNIEVADDWATFYCAVSGTSWEPSPGDSATIKDQTVIDPVNNIDTTIPEKLPESFPETPPSDDEPTACTTEIPVGEIIDRTQKLGNKLIERLQKLNELSQELSKAVEDLHVLVSQCTSAGPTTNPVRAGCYSICTPSMVGCVKFCQGSPCPTGDIEKKMKEITDIVKGIPNELKDEGKKDKEGIKDVVEAKKKTKKEDIEDTATREQIGIKTIIDDIVPKVFTDLDLKVRKTLKVCLSGSETQNLALDCDSAKNGKGPDGNMISTCCLTEPSFTKCLSQCYLEIGNDDYKKCLRDCLKKEAERTGEKALEKCLHSMNFYCCGI